MTAFPGYITLHPIFTEYLKLITVVNFHPIQTHVHTPSVASHEWRLNFACQNVSQSVHQKSTCPSSIHLTHRRSSSWEVPDQALGNFETSFRGFGKPYVARQAKLWRMVFRERLGPRQQQDTAFAERMTQLSVNLVAHPGRERHHIDVGNIHWRSQRGVVCSIANHAINFDNAFSHLPMAYNDKEICYKFKLSDIIGSVNKGTSTKRIKNSIFFSMVSNSQFRRAFIRQTDWKQTVENLPIPALEWDFLRKLLWFA